jgi:hypothetical protein
MAAIAMNYKLDKPRTNNRRKLDREKPESDRTQPFNPNELDKLPQPREDDPPYRPWWVIERP